jgi:hypothetical protein
MPNGKTHLPMTMLTTSFMFAPCPTSPKKNLACSHGLHCFYDEVQRKLCARFGRAEDWTVRRAGDIAEEISSTNRSGLLQKSISECLDAQSQMCKE